MADFPALPFWTDAYLADTTHLTTEQHGAYCLLLFKMWRQPDCDLPDDPKLMAKLAGITSAKWPGVWSVLKVFFLIGPNGRWTQKRLMKEREYVNKRAGKAYREQRSIAGKASAAKRNGNGNPTDCQRDFNESGNENPNEISTEVNEATPTPISKNPPPPSGSAPRRLGSKLPDDWQPSEGDLAYAVSHKFEMHAGHPDDLSEVGALVLDFRAYFTTDKGRNETSSNWSQRWQRWVRTEAKWRKEKSGVRPNGSGRVDARSVARKIAEAEGMVGDADRPSGGVPAAAGDGHGPGIPIADLPRSAGRTMEPTDRGEGDQVRPSQVEILPVDRGDRGGVPAVRAAVATDRIEAVPAAQWPERQEPASTFGTGATSLRIVAASVESRDHGRAAGEAQDAGPIPEFLIAANRRIRSQG